MIVKNIEKKEDNKYASFQVEIDAAEFDAAVNKAYLRNKKDITITGFRKGKAPRSVIEGMYGADVFYREAMDDIAPAAFEFGYDNCGLKIIGRPSISDVDLSDEKVLTYTFAVELYPEVTLGQYKNLSAPKAAAVLDENAVQEEINAVLKQNARMVDVDDREAQMGDTANIDFEGFLDGVAFEGGKGENFNLELGSGTFVPGFEDQVVGMKLDEEKEINITFPENYAEELAGKDVVFKVKLNAITVAELPELDDELVQDISEFETVDEFKADIKAELEKTADNKVEGEYRTAIITQACDNMTCDIPDSMIEQKIEEFVRNYAANMGLTSDDMSFEELKKLLGIDDAAIDNSIRPSALFQVKQDLLLNAIIEEEKLEVTDEELDKYIEDIAADINSKPEELRSYFGEGFIRRECLMKKATDAIFDTATVSEDKAE